MEENEIFLNMCEAVRRGEKTVDETVALLVQFADRGWYPQLTEAEYRNYVEGATNGA